MIANLAAERVWVEKNRFEQAERQMHELASKQRINKTATATDYSQLNGNHKTNQESAKNKIDNVALQINAELTMPTVKNANKGKKIKKSESIVNNAELADVAVNAAVEAPGAQATQKKKNKKNHKQAKQAQEQKQQQQSTLLAADNIVADSSTAADKIASKSAYKSDNLVAKPKGSTSSCNQSTLVSEIAKAREHIKNSLEKMDGIATLASSSISGEVLDRIGALEKDNSDLRKLVESMRTLNLESQKRIAALEARLNGAPSAPAAAAAKAPAKDADDDDVDLFGSEDEEENAEAAALREKRLAAYAEKKSKKPALIAKSSLVLDVKPWDDETDLKVMETEIRKIQADGLLWGASKFAPVAFGIQKLTISCVVEDDKVSIDWLTEEIEKLEDYVQSVDVAAFNKI